MGSLLRQLVSRSVHTCQEFVSVQCPICDLFCHALVSSLPLHNCWHYPLGIDIILYATLMVSHTCVLYIYVVCTYKLKYVHMSCTWIVYAWGARACGWGTYIIIIVIEDNHIDFTWFCVMVITGLAAKKCMAVWSMSQYVANGMSYVICISAQVCIIHVCVSNHVCTLILQTII